MDRNRLVLAATAALCIVVFNLKFDSLARAQATVQFGSGIKAGNFELHPGVTFRGGYDTNVFRGDGDNKKSGGQEILGAGIFRLTPELYITTQTPKRALGGEGRGISFPALRLNLGLSGGPVHYTDMRGTQYVPTTSTTDDPSNLMEQKVDYAEPQLPKAWEWGLTSLLSIRPDRPNNLDVGFNSQRTVTPFTASTGKVSDFTVMTARPSVKLNVGTESRVFTGYVGYAPGFTFYQGTFEYLSNVMHDLSGGTAWAFLPSTALLYEVNVGLQDYRKEIGDFDAAARAEPQKAADGSAIPVAMRADCSSNPLFAGKFTSGDLKGAGCPGVRVADSVKFKNRIGLNGALTNTAYVRALVGYVALFLPKDELLLSEKDGVVGDLTFVQAIAQRHRLEAGYMHDVIPSPAGSYVLSDRIGAKVVLNVGQSLILSLDTAYSHLSYGPLILTNGLGAGINGTTDRKDHKFDAILHAEYGFTEWMSVLADITASTVNTDFEYNNTLRKAPDPAGYTQFTFYGGVRAHY